VNRSGLTVSCFDELAGARARLSGAIEQAVLRLSRLDPEKGRRAAAKLYAVMDAALDEVHELGREPARFRCICGELHHASDGHVCRHP
jgi:hypothetical protein